MIGKSTEEYSTENTPDCTDEMNAALHAAGAGKESIWLKLHWQSKA